MNTRPFTNPTNSPSDVASPAPWAQGLRPLRPRFLAGIGLIAAFTVGAWLLLRQDPQTWPEGSLLRWATTNADLIVLFASSAIVLALLAGWASWLRVNRSTVAITALLVACVLGVGSWLVWNEGESARDRLRSGMESSAPMFAAEMSVRGHWRLASDAPADNPLYLDLIESEKRWLKMCPSVADIYTTRRSADGKWHFIVDSETDYDHSGAIDDEREQRTGIGEEVESAIDHLEEAATGKAVFQDHPETDRWGTWVSAFVPIYGERGEVEAVLGVDFPASGWAAAIASARLGMIGYIGVMLTILVGGAALQISYRYHINLRLQGERELHEKAAELAAAKVLLENSHQRLEVQNRELGAAKLAAESANHAKSQFLANMSHEIRTPMTAIIGYVDMLTDPEMPASLRESHAQTIKRSGRHLLGIINNILDISKIESGQMTVESIECELAPIVEDAVALLRQLAQKKGLALNVQWQGDVPTHLHSDPMRLREILVNLLGNAIKYTSEGEVSVTISAGIGLKDQPSIFLAVRDSGIGLTPEQAASLFQSFKQADSSHSRRFGGIGLGLVISKRFAEMLGGTITIDSTPNVGSTFTASVAISPIVNKPSNAAGTSDGTSAPRAASQPATAITSPLLVRTP